MSAQQDGVGDRIAARKRDAQSALAIAGGLQARASDPRHSAWVSASAGTGKTKVLVDRVLRLLLGGAPPERILCITFTKAAAAEMANRIDRELARWATAEDEALAEMLRRLDGAAVSAARLDRARGLFARVLEAPGGLAIQTIHAFCQAVLKRFPIEAGLAPHFAVIDQRDAAALLAEARHAVIAAARHAPGGDLDRALSVMADIAAEDGFKALIDRIIGRPERLRAALAGGYAAFKDKLHGALGLAPDESEADIIAAACVPAEARDAALRAAASAMLGGGGVRDGENARRILDWLAEPGRRAERYRDYLCAYFTAGGGGDRRKELLARKLAAASPHHAEALAREAERLDGVRSRCAAARTAASTAALFCLGQAVLAHYEHAKRLRAALDFGDLIDRTRALLAENGRAAWVLWKLDGGIDHVLVDEAQDTSPEQWQLIRLLVEEFFAGQGVERGARTLFVVGDFKQSIFSFQGAAPDEFRAMHAAFRARAAAAREAWADVPLSVSFRSVAAVLDAVDRVFALDAAKSGVAEAAEEIAHLSARGNLAGLVEVWPTVRPRAGDEDTAWVEAPPEAAMAEPHERIAREIARRIAQWIARGEELESLGRAIHAGDVMVLVRRRGPFMDAMVGALKAAGIAVTGVDRMRLGEQLAVQDLVALGRFLLLPEDDLALANVLKGPLFGFDDDRHLFPLAYGRGQVSLWQRLGEMAGRDPAFADARSRLESLLARADFMPPYELFAGVVEAGGGRRAMLSRLGPEAEDAIDEFLELALQYQARHAPSLEGFLHWLAQEETEVKRDLDQAGRDEVRVMTVHGAKGLQAPIVFLADTVAVPVEDERVLWPEGADARGLAALPLYAPSVADEIPEARSRRAALRAKQMEEYRRLLYVALTRAADRLYICGYETSRRASEECWYALVAKALAQAPTIPFAFDEDWQGPGWRFEQAGRPERPAEPPIRRQDADVALEAWAREAVPPEPSPSRPLAPSRPAEAEPPVRSPFAGDDSARFRRGLLIHRLLQTLPELPPPARDAAARRYLARREHGLDAEAIEAILRETLAVFDVAETAALFRPGSLAEVPITGQAGTAVVSGQIDRLAVGADEVLVIDYKTNRAPPRDPAAAPPLYVRQMAAYRALLGAIYPGRRIRCFLLWTDGPVVMELPAAALDAAGPPSSAKS